MALTVNTNIASVKAQRYMHSAIKEQATAMDRLSSGKRINSAADDAAGLSISTRMTSQINGLNQAIRNANDGISMLQVADGALENTSSILQRMKELSVQAANGHFGSRDRIFIDAEFKLLSEELDRIAGSTTFNGNTLFGNENRNRYSFHVGGEPNQFLSALMPSVDSKALGRGSVVGDLIGAEIAIDSSGLKSALADNAIKINGQELSALDKGTTLQNVLRQINADIDGVTATSLAEMKAKNVGNGELSGSDTFKITGTDKDGVGVSYTFTDTKSLGDLANKINDATNGNVYATIDTEGKLNLSSSTLARFSAIDSSSNGASGFSGGVDDADIAATINGLQSYWISEAEDLIETHYGITGNGDLELVINGVDDGVGGALASVAWSMDGSGNLTQPLKLNVDMSDFTADNQPDGGSAPVYNDRIIAHEMVHAVMASTMNLVALDLPGWFTEGVAELIHGADERVVGDYASIDNNGEQDSLLKTTAGSPSTSPGYSVSYLAAKMMHDDIYAASGGAAGMDAVLKELANGAASFDAALQTVTATYGITWNGQSGAGLTHTDFETHYLANDIQYLTGTYANSTLNLGDTDTGSIAGSDYGKGAKTAQSILANDPSSGPASDYNLVIPEEYGGSAVSAEARIVLNSDTGDEIVVKKDVSGSDTDLETLGFNDLKMPGDAGINRSSGTSISQLSLLDEKGAKLAMETVEFALDSVSEARADIGSMRNRLDFTIDNLASSVENAVAARSRIMDADFAAESAALSRAQVLQQASQSMLAQANSQPQQVLQLLQ